MLHDLSLSHDFFDGPIEFEAAFAGGDYAVGTLGALVGGGCVLGHGWATNKAGVGVGRLSSIWSHCLVRHLKMGKSEEQSNQWERCI